MSFRTFFFCAVLAVASLSGAAFSGVAHAQVGVYGTVTGERMSGITCLDPQNRCASNDGSTRPYGLNFGGYYDFRDMGPSLLGSRLGVDLRGGLMSSSKRADQYGSSLDLQRHYIFLIGPRLTFHTRIHALSPYAEVLGGLGRTNLDTQPGGTLAESYRNYGQVQGLVGADLHILPMLDLRILELGAGAMFGPGTHGLQSIGAGIVIHGARR
jgi:hypothetical protein